MEQKCKICGNEHQNRVHIAREMAFGLRDEFRYLECGQCGCVQLLDIPSDMAKYYAQGYYSLQPHGKFKVYVRRKWSAHAFGQKNLVGWLFSELFFAHRSMLAVSRINPPKNARILDVGCGRGNLLMDLAWLGFANLTGVDPFLSQDLAYDNGVKIFKRQLSDLDGRYDLIMLHHSFEHMDNPAKVIRDVAARLTPSGQALLGIPVASSFAWKHYGVNWVNLDAPRHFFLHTTKSIELLTAKTGLVIDKIVHEGNDEQFWMSEQYANNVSGHDPGSLNSSIRKRAMAWAKIQSFRRRAAELNQKGEGDMACFHLR